MFKKSLSLALLGSFLFAGLTTTQARSEQYDVTSCKKMVDKSIYSLKFAKRSNELGIYETVKLWLEVKKPKFMGKIPEFLNGLPVEKGLLFDRIEMVNTNKDTDHARFILASAVVATSLDLDNNERSYKVSFKDDRKFALLEFMSKNRDSVSAGITSIAFTNCSRSFQNLK